MIKILNLLKKILPVYLLITFSFSFAQDSTNSNSNLILNSITSRFNLSLDIPQNIGYNFFDPLKKDNIAIASQPIFINSEHPMIDGTNWRKYSDVDYLRLSSKI